MYKPALGIVLFVILAPVLLCTGCGDDGGGKGNPAIFQEQEPNDSPADIRLHNFIGKPSIKKKLVGRLDSPDDLVDVFRFVAENNGVQATADGYGELEPVIFIREIADDGYSFAATQTAGQATDQQPATEFDAELTIGKTYDIGIATDGTSGRYRIFLTWR